MTCSPVWAQNLPNAPSAQKATVKKTQASEANWPRTVTSGADTFLIYQPQVEKWDGNRVYLYSAVELKTGKNAAAKYGVVWFNARTEVDKINRLVTLDQVELTKVTFPAGAEKEAELNALLQNKVPGATKTMSLDRLQASLEAAGEEIKGVEVKNDPPKVIIAMKPSLLVLIDGMPQLREIQGTTLQRVINTRAVLLFETDKKTYYLRVQDWWLQAKELEGPWTYAKKLPDDMKKAEEYVVTQAAAQTLESDQGTKPPSLKEAGKNAEISVVYVEFGPAELIETKGEPVYKSIPGTGLEYRHVEPHGHAMVGTPRPGPSDVTTAGDWRIRGDPSGWKSVVYESCGKLRVFQRSLKFGSRNKKRMRTEGGGGGRRRTRKTDRAIGGIEDLRGEFRRRHQADDPRRWFDPRLSTCEKQRRSKPNSRRRKP